MVKRPIKYEWQRIVREEFKEEREKVNSLGQKNDRKANRKLA